MTNKHLLTIYLASPYSLKDKDIEEFRYHEISRIAAKLHMKFPHAFILPITQSHKLKLYEPKLGGTFAKWRDRDLLFIDKSDEVWVVMLDGWKDSIGVTAEIDHAHKTGKPVKYINPNTMRFKKSTKRIANETTKTVIENPNNLAFKFGNYK
jgi:nucleoside 2-deoxyribosyltransferase